MQELNALLPYIDKYIYSFEYEEIVINDDEDEDTEEIKKLYYKAVKTVRGEKVESGTEPEKIDLLDLYRFNDPKRWMLDIALDCVRKMSEEDREYVKNHMDVTEYHFGYALGIRNTYLYKAKLKRPFSADIYSNKIMGFIFSILDPLYDYRSR